MITTERRTDDWIAFAFGDRRIWEAGKTEAEAVGRLILRLQAEGHAILTTPDEDGRVQEQLGEMQAYKPIHLGSKLRFDLRNVFSNGSSEDVPPVPAEVVVDGCSIMVSVPAAPDAAHSAAEVYVEHYEGRVVVRVWDQETLCTDYSGDPVSEIVLLTDSTKRNVGDQDVSEL